jgi:hypothetical protein
MPWMRFESTIPASERAKTVHALDRSATVTGPIEDYTEIFYTIDKGDIPSIQCKVSLRESKSIWKLNGLSLIFIIFYVP